MFGAIHNRKGGKSSQSSRGHQKGPKAVVAFGSWKFPLFWSASHSVSLIWIFVKLGTPKLEYLNELSTKFRSVLKRTSRVISVSVNRSVFLLWKKNYFFSRAESLKNHNSVSMAPFNLKLCRVTILILKYFFGRGTPWIRTISVVENPGWKSKNGDFPKNYSFP